jgi:hypothetical protein
MIMIKGIYPVAPGIGPVMHFKIILYIPGSEESWNLLKQLYNEARAFYYQENTPLSLMKICTGWIITKRKQNSFPSL